MLAANEWGDWAAGIAAPLAFLWLVLGYMQQGAEISENTRELARSVDAQNRLVGAAEKQAAAAALATSSNAYATVLTFQPTITLLNVELEGAISANLRNDGRWCYEVKPHITNANYAVRPAVLEAWGPGLNQVFYFDVPPDRDIDFEVAFDYLDVFGNQQRVEFRCYREQRKTGVRVIGFYPKPFVPKLAGTPLTVG